VLRAQRVEPVFVRVGVHPVGLAGVLQDHDPVPLHRTRAGNFDQADPVLAQQRENVLLDQRGGGGPLVAGLGGHQDQVGQVVEQFRRPETGVEQGAHDPGGRLGAHSVAPAHRGRPGVLELEQRGRAGHPCSQTGRRLTRSTPHGSYASTNSDGICSVVRCPDNLCQATVQVASFSPGRGGG
jgi:hypothetical protein